MRSEANPVAGIGQACLALVPSARQGRRGEAALRAGSMSQGTVTVMQAQKLVVPYAVACLGRYVGSIAVSIFCVMLISTCRRQVDGRLGQIGKKL